MRSISIDFCRLSVAIVMSLTTASSAVSAFQSSSSMMLPITIHQHQNHYVSPTQRSFGVSLMAYYPPPYSDPYFNNNPFFFPIPPPYMNTNPYYYQNQRRRRSVALDADYITESDELLNDLQEEDDWMPDRQRAAFTKQQDIQEGEVINFDPEQPRSRPLKNAAAYPSDNIGNNEDENKFQGRMPGQPVNRSSNDDDKETNEGRRTAKATIVDERRDPREQHVILDDMNDFFEYPIPPPRPPPPHMNQRRRPGPSVYTPEEEDLIARMGGRGGPRTTQEFAGLGTMKNNRSGRLTSSQLMDPQQLNYNPEQIFNGPEQMQPGVAGGSIMPPPQMPMMPPPGLMEMEQQQQYREEGFLGDSTLKEISLDYSVPIPYLADVLATWGVPVPINIDIRLGDMITGEQAFAILEAIHTLDIAQLHSQYSEDNLLNICDYYDIDIKVAFDFCIGRGWALPFGVRTFLRVEQEEEMLDALG